MDGTVWVGWMEHTWIEYYVHKMVHCGSLIAHRRFELLVRLWPFATGGSYSVCRFTLQRRRRLLLLSSFLFLFYLLSVRLV